MTDQRNPWDDAEQSLVNAEAEWRVLLAQVPDTMPHTATRNRIVNVLTALADAQDFGTAARARMPKTDTPSTENGR